MRQQAQPKKRKQRPGTVALREIKKLQKQTELIIPRLPFQRLVKDIMLSRNEQMRLSSQGLQALQEAAECYLTNLFDDA